MSKRLLHAKFVEKGKWEDQNQGGRMNLIETQGNWE